MRLADNPTYTFQQLQINNELEMYFDILFFPLSLAWHVTTCQAFLAVPSTGDGRPCGLQV